MQKNLGALNVPSLLSLTTVVNRCVFVIVFVVDQVGFGVAWKRCCWEGRARRLPLRSDTMYMNWWEKMRRTSHDETVGSCLWNDSRGAAPYAAGYSRF